ncbi:alpha/beta hydrolase [Adhaeribacter pallidiroseus]|uniref:Acetyl esterase n=1 Tax=Adhaeribacter pallidiroseus TaxID=2072847 RepID=A0A369QKT5_9BACT|nr:alpha/beta hydrolase family protein [Adhaeribacter pallidiroseus]RDC64950.1 Acetyl esterase [Adhaeribacter pallidiroseus]
MALKFTIRMSAVRYLFLFFIFLNFHAVQAAHVDTLEINSSAMNTRLHAGIVVPDSYKKQKKTTYPVLYLLHGYSGNFRDWLTKVPDKTVLTSLADQYQMIIVTPDGGFGSWYLDSPLDKASQYETFITKELVQEVQTKYRTITTREGRFISGLSMGGHGALYLSARHPDLYLAAASMSGALDIASIQGDLVKSMETLLGQKAQNYEKFAQNSVVNMVPQLKASPVKILFDCGVDDFLIESNRELHRRLVVEKVPHEYIERPGAHTWPYWGNALPYHLLFFQKARQEAASK